MRKTIAASARFARCQNSTWPISCHAGVRLCSEVGVTNYSISCSSLTFMMGVWKKNILVNPPLTWHFLFFYIMNFTFMDIYNYHFLSYCNSWRLSLILRSNKDYCFAEGLLYLQILTEINVSETCGYLF